ncbi:MAG: ATP phosphoribosyltransferase [Dehalococcoidia bacterium]|nr:MAG: ATP phosphoribosyltransferase [Dehalococcoidia bacterium]
MKDYQDGYVKLALPKGRFLLPTASLLAEISLGFQDYSDKTKQYRLRSARFPSLSAKILQEKDISIQVAVGNYDLGICGLDWIEEFLVKYPAGALVKISSLNYGEGGIHVAASTQAGITSLNELSDGRNDYRIVTEYPNLAEAFALNLRMRRFRIFPVWGAAEAYPPENADLAVLWGKSGIDIATQGLIPLKRLLPVTAFLIANRESLENKDLSQILTCFSSKLTADLPAEAWQAEPQTSIENGLDISEELKVSRPLWQAKEINLALPDGHQQPPTSQFLKRAGLALQGYSEEMVSRRPSADLDWLGIKVIRPQDMPLQVANNNFDLAITGEDWLLEHLYRFPSSPVKKLFALGFGAVKIVAAVSQEMPVADIDEVRSLVQSNRFAPLKVASEYINIADRYLRDNHINPYKLIPTWGASEAFLPEDADMLIDNIQTGKTLEQHKLKIIDVLFRSSACLIANKDSLVSSDNKEKLEFLTQKLRAGLK